MSCAADLYPEPFPPPVCSSCGRERTQQDPDYTPFQFITGNTVGWMSGDDGEFCGECLTAMMSGAWPSSTPATDERTEQ